MSFFASTTSLAFAPVASPRTSKPNAEASSRKGAVNGRIQLKRGRRRLRNNEGVVVYLEGVPETLPDTTNSLHEIKMQDKRFIPEVSVVLAGTSLSFPNHDHVYHNPFSTSEGAEFDLGLYGKGKTEIVKAKRPGTIEVHCNVHEQTAAKIFVLTTTYYAVTDTTGEFEIDDVPPGTYGFVASAPWGESTHGRVTVRTDKTAEVRVSLEAGRRERHRRKDGSPYDS